MTVGFGITPNLLTPPNLGGRSRADERADEPVAQLPPVGSFTPPRERLPPAQHCADDITELISDSHHFKHAVVNSVEGQELLGCGNFLISSR